MCCLQHFSSLLTNADEAGASDQPKLNYTLKRTATPKTL